MTVGNELQRRNYPVIHAGARSTRAPRLIDIVWGRPSAPKVTLIGKGVCFDSGGLDLKPASGMLNMKKDMGGAATVLAVASMVMAARLNLRLRVLIPAVENSVSGNAFRPMDIITSRKGVTVEIGNTDAEGRLVMCDALTEAVREEPALVVDVATLTGAARVALGPDVPALFCNDDASAEALLKSAREREDRCGACRCGALPPLPRQQDRRHQQRRPDAVRRRHHRRALPAGIRARLRAVDAHRHHGLEPGPARPPEGGEAMGARALFAMLKERYPKR